ncbi:MAG: acetylornithine deacetylase [Halofilum sp. (in: g-proteobacteria)]|nr:acetylornithine deacetylase [Halofilum sp. (in: g-proteobacteria)]
MSCALPERREMIARLIAQNTVSSRGDPALDHSNQAVIDLLADWAEGCGLRVRVTDVPDKPGKHNLVATLGDGPGGLALGGHADTVPWDADRWTCDPFRATEADGRLYGLGSCDMKSFLALALEAAAGFAGRDLERPVHLVVTADEECDMAGARALATGDGFAPEAAVIGEPTRLAPVRMRKGIFMERLRLVGCSGHSSDPEYGASALEGMHVAMGELLAIRDELQRAHHSDAFRVPTPTLNLGQIRGGDNPNRICGECELSFDLRVLPGMDLEAERTRIRARVTDALAGRGLAIHFEPLFEGTPPAETRADAPVVQAAETLTGEPAGAVAFGTEAAFYQRLGMDVVVLGPGSIAQAHQPDEYVELGYLGRTVDLLSGLIERFCMARPPLARRAG